MKKKAFITVIVVTIILFVVVIMTNYMDSARVRTGYEPKFCIKTVSYDENDDKEEKREYIKTYNVIEKLDITDETGTYNYYVIKQFQDDEPVLIKVANTYDLKKGKNYEFVLYGIKNESQKYTQNEIFANFEIKNIIETEKTGLEQTQEM